MKAFVPVVTVHRDGQPECVAVIQHYDDDSLAVVWHNRLPDDEERGNCQFFGYEHPCDVGTFHRWSADEDQLGDDVDQEATEKFRKFGMDAVKQFVHGIAVDVIMANAGTSEYFFERQ